MKEKQIFKKTIFLLLVFFILTLLIFNIVSFVIEKINLNDYGFGFFNNNNNTPFNPPTHDEIDKGFAANVFLFSVLQWIMIGTEDVGIILIGTFQDAILILFGGSIVYNALGINNYITYLDIILGIFGFLLLVFLSIKFFKPKQSNKQDKIFFKIFNSFVLLIMIVLVFQILFLGGQYFIEKVFNIDGGKINIFDQIEKITIGNIGNGMKQIFSKLVKITDKVVYNEELDKWFVVKKFKSHFTPMEVAYIISFLFSTWLILFMLVKFSISLFQRTIDIIFFGVIGFPLVAASSVEDGGKRMETWNGVMIQKTLKPFLSLLMYLLLLISMSSIFNIIDNIKVGTETSFSKEALILTLKMVVINGMFVVLNKFSNDWTDNIIKTNTENNVQEFVNIYSNNQKNINYDFNEDYSFATNNNLNKNITKNISNITKNISKNISKNKKELEPGISIDETLEKINGKDV